MSDIENMQLFENQPVRTAWNEEEEEWYFSVVDVIGILTESPNPQIYWRVMKKRLKDEGNETVTNCNGLKLKAADGKRRLTDVANTEHNFSVSFSLFLLKRRSLLSCGLHRSAERELKKLWIRN